MNNNVDQNLINLKRQATTSTVGQNSVLAMSWRLAAQRQYPKLALSSIRSNNSMRHAPANTTSQLLKEPRDFREMQLAAISNARPT